MHLRLLSFFFFNDTATTEIYTLSLHDALPIYRNPDRVLIEPILDLPPGGTEGLRALEDSRIRHDAQKREQTRPRQRSEEHTSELQSQSNLVCRLLLEKKNTR